MRNVLQNDKGGTVLWFEVCENTGYLKIEPSSRICKPAPTSSLGKTLAGKTSGEHIDRY